jgi:sterol desaturase/sphingolipid hydroxylase (fatty acid hydroxylase superfamily)
MVAADDGSVARAWAIAQALWRQFELVLAYPFDPEQRIFGLYLLTSLLFALWAYVRRPRGAGSVSLGRFLFPREVWSSPSAWLDVRYFFLHQMVRLVIYGPVVGFAGGLAYYLFTWLSSGRPPSGAPAGGNHVFGGLVMAAASVVLIDFVSYWIHVAQHRVRWLWEFHKVHHSATVLHPLSNYREHPVDNLAYGIGLGAVGGLMVGVAVAVFGFMPQAPTVVGVTLFTFIFNVLGYNLRHSHIWLRWQPDWLNVVFGSPAHHQVHHSCHPEHIDKNFAFMFPVWDKLFGTWCLPATNAQVRFGLGGIEEQEYRSCLDLYLLPFRKLLGHSRRTIA